MRLAGACRWVGIQWLALYHLYGLGRVVTGNETQLRVFVDAQQRKYRVTGTTSHFKDGVGKCIRLGGGNQLWKLEAKPFAVLEKAIVMMRVERVPVFGRMLMILFCVS